jgi:hypothetical protein
MADGFSPPQGVQSAARRGLKLRAEFNRGGTAVGVARARDLSNGKSIPLKTINRMVSYFARHEVDKKGKDWGNSSNPSAGYIAWLLWGGDAGKSWANSIAEREKKKDKSMALDMASTFAEIVKREKLDDGTLLVYGKATDDSIDIDKQICDAGWLEKAMPEWFKTGGNIREQHSNIAAGVAKELDAKKDGFYIQALVVDPVSVKKVETGVLKGFSIGIRSPRIVRDEKAANGRIIDGQIVEVSLVDRPANPNAKLMLAKCDNDQDLTKVEEYVEETPTVKGEIMEETQTEKAVAKPSKEEALKQLEEATKRLDEVTMMCKEMGYLEEKEHEEEAEDKRAYGESAEEETEEGSKPTAAEEEVEEAEGKKKVKAKKKAKDDKEKSAEVSKCLECGCDQPANAHGRDDVSTAVMVSPNQTPKSVETIIPAPEIEEVGTVIEDEDLESEDSEKSAKSDIDIDSIIAKAVKSATDSVTNEINSYKEEISKLQNELATAQNKAVGSGPKRFAVGEKVADELASFLAKAAEYRTKSATATDKDLARGYKELASDFEAKAKALTNK